MTAWRLTGPYLEACNCEAICPCRSIGGRDGSRAQYQLCQFAIAWTVGNGHFGELDMAGFQAVMAGYWDEDEPGSPWRVQLYVDDRADAAQQAALADIFLGRAGGTPTHNYTPAIKEVYGVREARIEVIHERGSQKICVGDAVNVVARAPFPSDATVSCGIPGHDQPGDELVHETLKVVDGPLAFEFHGRCGFRATFDYHS
ncbi:MAG: DUF1326 domain-containing protein [Chloroflexota bacterium]